jgi:preprotein translocase subunit SecY
MALFQGFSNITKVPELRRRIGFVLAILAIYRLGVFVTTPGVDRAVMKNIISGQGGLLGLFNLFSGGALENLSIFALGIMPYISASIIMQLLGMVSKQVEELKKEGETGRRKIEQYTRYGTIALSIFQSFGIAMMLESLVSFRATIKIARDVTDVGVGSGALLGRLRECRKSVR